MKKICSKCKKNKPLEEYYRDSRHKDGRFSNCKSCHNAKSKIYHAEHKQERAEYRREYTAEHKQQKAEYDKKYCTENKRKRAECSKIYHAEHKQERAEFGKKYYDENKLQIAERQKEQRKTAEGRATIARKNAKSKNWKANLINTFNDKEFNCTLLLQNYQCIGPDHEGNRYFDEVEPTRDHIKPASKGGDFIKENIQALCQSCNSKKRIQDIDYRSEIHKHIIQNQ